MISGKKFLLMSVGILVSLILSFYLYFYNKEIDSARAMELAKYLYLARCVEFESCDDNVKIYSVSQIDSGYEVHVEAEDNKVYRVLVSDKGKTFWVSPEQHRTYMNTSLVVK